MQLLQILVPNEKHFYTLYSDGSYCNKQQIPTGTVFSYLPNSIIILYYTYPTHRRAYIVRYIEKSSKAIALPGLSAPVKELARVHASKVDKLKKSVSFLCAHFGNIYAFSDAFFIRLHYIIQQKGKINYEAIKSLISIMGEKLWT